MLVGNVFKFQVAEPSFTNLFGVAAPRQQILLEGPIKAGRDIRCSPPGFRPAATPHVRFEPKLTVAGCGQFADAEMQVMS